MSAERTITVNCGGGCCLVSLLLFVATVVGLVVMLEHLVAWFA